MVDAVLVAHGVSGSESGDVVDAVLVVHGVSGSESGDVVDAVLVVHGVSGSQSGDAVDAVMVVHDVFHAESTASSRDGYRSRSRPGSSRKQCHQASACQSHWPEVTSDCPRRAPSPWRAPEDHPLVANNGHCR